MIITYDPKNGKVVPDKEILPYLCANKDRNITIGSSLLIDAARLLHKRKKINIEYILYEESKIFINEDGRLSEWPKGFCDGYDKILSELI